MFRRIPIVIFALLPCICLAAKDTNNSWELVLSKIANSLTGPVTYFIAIMVIFSCGMIMAFADLQSGGKRFVQAACGIAIAAASAQILTKFLGFNGALI